MSEEGASFKSYCITITTAICGFAVTLHRPGVALLALLAIVAFALVDAQYLRVYVRQLRQKIEADPERPEYILTETGIGYRLRAPD